VLLRKATTGSSTSLLIDGTHTQPPSWSTDNKVALPAGRAIPVGGGAFTITVEEETLSSVTLRVVTAASAPFPRDWTGDGYSDLIAADASGTLFVYPGTYRSGFQPRRLIGRGWQARDLITMTGDWTGDGRPDLVARNPATGELWLYAGTGSGGFLNWRVIGRGWQVMDALLSPGDWDGDGHADLLARTRSDGRLLLYSGDGRGGFLGGAVQVGSGWKVMTALVATGGDWDLDGLPDFAARRSDGDLYLYTGDGMGGFLGARVIGHGWQIFNALTGPGDWGSDGYADLVVRRTDGSLWHYINNGFGAFRASQKVGAGWTGFRLAS
jgi:FG-GAP-like repeat